MEDILKLHNYLLHIPETNKLSSEEKQYWYFAFGSNMSSEVFASSRGMSPLSKEVAKLEGFELVFDQKGVAIVEPAFASIKESKESDVWGVLYQLTEADFTRLHYTEGDHYEARRIDVIGSNSGRIGCYTYIGIHSTPGLDPSRRYASKLISGAKENDLPSDYIRQLESINTTHIPLVSEFAGLVMKLVLMYTAKGRTINLGVGKSGAKIPASYKENV